MDDFIQSEEIKSLITGSKNTSEKPKLKEQYNMINIKPISETNFSNNTPQGQGKINTINSQLVQKDKTVQNETIKVGKKIRCIKELTRTGFNGTETKKNNQDIAIIYPNFNKQKDNYFFSVCDGHGLYGHDVSRAVKASLPINLENDLIQKNLNVFTSDKQKVYKSIEDMFNLTNFNLNSHVDTEYSGSTCVSMIYSPTKILTANIGDSRIIMGRFEGGSKFNLFRMDH